ncbi:MAG: hypothetical protein M3328_14880 [Chloroflexota bacterium]|nr:hypothetical protein [Chloroflexota bacterium]
MSTGHMPNPPDHLTTQATARDTQGQSAGEEPSAQPTQPLSLEADMARMIEEQIDAIAQRQVYHSQMLLGVSAMPTDPVTARTSALMVADALRQSTSRNLEHTLVNLGNPQIAQVNDRTLPYKLNAQLAGLLEGILIDVVTQGYRDDPDRQRTARGLLESLFQPANERMQLQPKHVIAFGAPAMGQDRQLTAGSEPAANS